MNKVKAMEVFISKLLWGGVVLSGLLLVAGLGLLWVTGDTSCPYGVMTFDWVLGGDPFLEPSHVIFLGFLVLIMTPVLRIVASTVVYAWMHDWLYTMLTGVVLVILVVSMTLGIG
ncbi:MAG: DUF1634 domain-containing protein [Candidatus Bathyarchaeota archaeon]|nr:DUF1634 domain-containing protein [Candidatus Bathyarchaeota archaeon]